MDENDADANLYSNSVSEESEAVIIPEPVTGIEVAMTISIWVCL